LKELKKRESGKEKKGGVQPWNQELYIDEGTDRRIVLRQNEKQENKWENKIKGPKTQWKQKMVKLIKSKGKAKRKHINGSTFHLKEIQEQIFAWGGGWTEKKSREGTEGGGKERVVGRERGPGIHSVCPMDEYRSIQMASGKERKIGETIGLDGKRQKNTRPARGKGIKGKKKRDIKEK